MINPHEDEPREPSITPSGESAATGAAPAPQAHESPALPAEEQPLFAFYTQPPVRRPVRIPHFGHLLLLSLLILAALGIVVLGLGIASYFHLCGLKLTTASATDVRFNLLSEAALDCIAFGFCLFVFPMIWDKSYFAGVQWRGEAVRSGFWILAGIALACFGLAILDQIFMPGPDNAPIDKMISSPGAAWLMFAFGVTFAPFFEEMFFRGFLLPALSTAADWIGEKVSVNTPVVVGANGRAQRPAAAIAAAWFSLGSVPAVFVLAFYWKSGQYTFKILPPYLVALVLFFIVLAFRKSSSPEPAGFIDAGGEPSWSFSSMAIAAILTSMAFAGLHVAQQGHSLGPFLLLIAISLVLCAVRLITRSLAASTLVHAAYNFLIFVAELVATGGFRHFDRM